MRILELFKIDKKVKKHYILYLLDKSNFINE